MTTQPLLDYLSNRFTVTDADAKLLADCFKYSAYPKNTILEPAGKIAERLYFVLSGYIRVVRFEEDTEITTHIAGKDNLVTAFQSFNARVVSTELVQCISTCEVLWLTKADYQLLTEKCTLWSPFCKYIYEKVITTAQQRTSDLLTLSADKRYLKLLSENPDFIQHVPVQYLASYIGIKPESLSRIRKKIIS